MTGMPDPNDLASLRASLIEGLRACRAAEIEIFAALDPAARDAPGPDGGWSAKDHLAHLSAWRQHQATKMAALREGRPEPELPADDIDEINAIFHADRADWTWQWVVGDADATTDALIAEVSAASDEALADPTVVGSIMSDGPEHDLGHLGPIATEGGLERRVLELADLTLALHRPRRLAGSVRRVRPLQPRLLPRARRPAGCGACPAPPGTPRAGGAADAGPDR